MDLLKTGRQESRGEPAHLAASGRFSLHSAGQRPSYPQARTPRPGMGGRPSRTPSRSTAD